MAHRVTGWPTFMLATFALAAPLASSAQGERQASGPVRDTTGSAASSDVARAIAEGDSANHAMHTQDALAAYQRAIGLDSANYDALTKAARASVDLGEYEPDKDSRRRYFDAGLALARRAVTLQPNDAEGHFHVARALGREALSVGPSARVRYAKEVRAEALEALSHNPHHPGALHVMGVWNAEIMRLSGIERFFARNLLGGGILGTASWDEARRYMQEAVAVDPGRIVHHLDLGKIYADIGDKAKAREELETVLRMTPAEYNDAHYQDEAKRRLDRL